MNKKVHLAILALACWVGLSGTPSHAAVAAQTGACGPDVVPIVLTGEPKSAEYPQPVCSKCKDLKVERQTTSTGSTHGVLALTYFDEVYTQLSGAIVLTLVLADDSERVVAIDDVELAKGEHARWVIDAGLLDWGSVETVWVEFVPGE